MQVMAKPAFYEFVGAIRKVPIGPHFAFFYSFKRMPPMEVACESWPNMFSSLFVS